MNSTAPSLQTVDVSGRFALERTPLMVEALRSSFRLRKTRSLDWRKSQLKALRSLLREEKDKILEALQADLGKSEFEGWLSEVSFLDGEIGHALSKLSAWTRPQKIPTQLAVKPGSAEIVREPLGVVLIIGPWNYPFQLLIAPLIGAIGAGNCAVLKPSEVSAHTSKVIAELVPKYLDSDCFAVVEGGVSQTTALLKERFDHIFYTGNSTVGRIVMTAAAKHLTPVTLELGGKSPTIVDYDTDLAVTAHRIGWGKFFNAGQTCVAPDYVLVHEDAVDELTEQLIKAIREFYGDDPKSSPDYGRIINERHWDRLTQVIGDGQIVYGGEVDREARYIAPTILRGVSPDSAVMEDEIFGPILPLIPVPNIQSAIDFINERPKPLALYLFSNSKKTRQQVLEQTSSGGVSVNETMMHLLVSGLPFGGVGESGMGAYHGKHTFETFSHRRSVLTRTQWMDPKFRYPPYNSNKMWWMKQLVR